MLKSTTFALMTLAVTFNAVAFEGDELFSDFQSGSVFASAESDDSSNSRRVTRVTSAEKLRDLIKVAGLDAKAADSRVVSTEKVLSPWTFPVLLELSEDETTVNVVLGLTTIKDAATDLKAETLLQMMEASRKNAPMLFSYNAGRKRTELSLLLKNENLTGQSLRDQINRLAIVARDNSKMWASEAQTKSPEDSTEQPTETSTTPALSGDVLTGKWAAARSAKEAFAVEFNAEGKFNLVYINGTSQTKSSGTFTIASSTLTLVGSDGLKLQGSVTLTSSTEFSFKPANGDALKFNKAK